VSPAKKSPKRKTKVKAKAKARPKTKPAVRPRKPAVSSDDLSALREELDAARAELARIASDENHWRRDLDAQISAQSTHHERLRGELEAVRIDLRTALAELEIARANEKRAEQRFITATRELSEAREAERRAEHASDSVQDELHQLRNQVQSLMLRIKEPLS
jgi:chromosome segregation ATPase